MFHNFFNKSKIDELYAFYISIIFMDADDLEHVCDRSAPRREALGPFQFHQLGKQFWLRPYICK